MSILEQIEARAAAVIDPTDKYVKRFKDRILIVKKPWAEAEARENLCDRAAMLAQRGLKAELPLTTPEEVLEWAKAIRTTEEVLKLLGRDAHAYRELARRERLKYLDVINSCLGEVAQDEKRALRPYYDKIYWAQGNGGGKELERAQAEFSQAQQEWIDLHNAVEARLKAL